MSNFKDQLKPFTSETKFVAMMRLSNGDQKCIRLVPLAEVEEILNLNSIRFIEVIREKEPKAIDYPPTNRTDTAFLFEVNGVHIL